MTTSKPLMNRKNTARQDQFLPGKALPVMVAIGLVVFLVVYLVVALRGAGQVGSNSLLQPPSPQQISPIFTTSVQHWEPKIVEWASANGLDPNLVATVMQIESCGNPNAVSIAGASGLFQVMPFHFYDGEDHFDPDTNAMRGMAYLSDSLYNADGLEELALAGYNGGIGIIFTDQAYWANETLDYMYWGGGIYADAASGVQESPRLQEWLGAGGYSLCNSAQVSLGLP